MVSSVANPVELDDTVTSKLSPGKLLAENEKVQDDLAFKLRNLIANFCDEHFVKYLKENKVDKSSNVALDSEKTNIIESLKTGEEELTKLNETANDSNDSSNNVEMIDATSPANSSSEMKEAVEVSKNSDLNITSTSSLTPPRSSYSSTSSSSSSSSSSTSSDININSQSNDEANKTLENDPDSSSHSSVEVKEKLVGEERTSSNDISSISNNNTSIDKTSKTLNDIIDKLDIIDHASKTIKEISTSAELNHHRLQHMELQKEELQSQSSALEKLWSQILIGADKLEIFGSIHVRSNNVRLFSCLIDEQLHIDNQSFSSASSCVSQDSCSSKILIKKSSSKLNNLRSKNLYKYERQMALSNFYRKKMNQESYRRYKKAQQHAQDFYDINHSGYNHYYNQKHHQKQQKLAKKVEDLIKAASPENTKKVEEPYPMKKFKAYHSYCSDKKKPSPDEQTVATANAKNTENQSHEYKISEKEINNEVTSLSNLATVAAAAMRLSSSEATVNNNITNPAPVKKSRKSSITNSVKQRSFSKDLDADVELEIDEDEYANNSHLIDQSNGKMNEFYNLYEVEEDFEDTSSVLSGTSSFVSSQNKDHRHRRNHSAHSRCSSFGENVGLSSRSISLNGDISRSPSKVQNKVSIINHRSISPASSLASSNFDYDDEQVYQSYCSTSSFKSDYEDEYGTKGEEFSNKKYHHSRKMEKNKKVMNEDNEKTNENSAMNDVMMKEKSENGISHYHSRKHHLIDAEHKDGDLKNEFKTEKDSQNHLQVQQAQLKLQQLPKLLGLQQQQHQELQQQHQQQQEEARKNDDYLAKKYKYNRRFAPYNNSTNQASNFNSAENNVSVTDNANLYLLAQSRHHHRMNQSDLNGQNDSTKNSQYQNGHTNTSSSNKLMSVNSLVDRLSPISDPDTERKAAEQSKLHHQANGHAEVHMLNRINNLSPSSSSSSSSSNKNHQNGNSGANQLFHHNSMQQQAVLAAASSQSTIGSSPHNHLNGHSNHHAQSVAALLANMQHDQQHNSQDVAKVLAATLNTHHHMNQHNHHTQQIINRFSSNPSQSELMAAVLAQQQQQHRTLLESNNQFNLNPNSQLYSRYSSHLNAAVAAAAAAAVASNAAVTVNGHNSRRAHSVESDAHTPSPPASTPANVNGQNGSGSSSLSSSSSSSSSTSSENYAHNSKYNMHDRVKEEMCKKERSSSVTSHTNDPNSSSSEKVRLVPGYDVFISANDLNACNDDRGSATRLLRNLMDVFFDKSTLAKSSINGTGRITNTLDKHVISALFGKYC